MPFMTYIQQKRVWTALNQVVREVAVYRKMTLVVKKRLIFCLCFTFFSLFYLVSSFRVNHGLDIPLGSGLVLVVTYVSSITISSSL